MNLPQKNYKLRVLAGLIVVGLILSGFASMTAANVPGHTLQQGGDGLNQIEPDSSPLRLEDIDGITKPPLVDGRPSDVDSLVFVDHSQDVAPSETEVAAIDVWYGPAQSFGVPGITQDWVNILGQVTGTAPYTLTYTLNGGAVQSLNVGQDGFRLTNEGDFNIELDPATLSATNAILLNLQDGAGELATASVTVNYTGANVWPLPYTANWSGDIQTNAQVVDGNWVVSSGSVELASDAAIGYDRVLTIGDPGWTDYEVTVPVTVYKIDPKGYEGVNGGPNMGIALRWDGHFEVEGEGHPYTGWQNLGALAVYRWYFAGGEQTESLQIFGYGGATLVSNNTKPLVMSTPYIFKMSVQSAAVGPSYYRFKMWEAANPEPLAWDMETFGKEGEPVSGSLVLQAHYADVLFGKVTVEAVADIKPKLTVTTSENGSVIILPDKTDTEYAYGEVVEIYPVAETGYRLGSWGGDAAGTADPLIIQMTKDTNIVANFEEAPAPIVTVTQGENGQTTVTPPGPDYTYGETVNLTAIPDDGYQLYSWGGNQSGNTNPLTIVLAGDVTVAPIFSELRAPFSDDFNTCQLDTSLWTFVNPLEDESAYAINDGQTLEIDVAGGVSHGYWVGGMNAPRVMQAAEDTDMDLVAKFNSTVQPGVGTNSQMQGIAIEGAGGKNISANFYSDQSVVHVFIGTFDANNGDIKIDEVITPPADSDLHLRVARAGNQWELFHSFEGVTWISDGKFSFDMEVQDVGVYAGNFFVNPPFKAEIDYFFNTGAPIVDEDGGTLELTVNVDGQGQVAKSPDKTAYACGEAISLTATPAAGWSFSGWSGDATGSDNPTTINFDLGDSVTAKFVSEGSYTLDVKPSGQGTVTVTPEKSEYAGGETVTLAATPATGWSFIGWGGAVEGTDNPTTYTFGGAENVVTVDAIFRSDAGLGDQQIFLPVVSKTQ